MNYEFCPKCGGKLIEEEEHGYTRPRCSACGFIFYQNSKPTVSILILDGDKVLLGKRNVEPSKGMWDVPGGFLEAGEPPEEGAWREIREETGLEVEILDMLGIFMDEYGADKIPTLNICYTAGVKGGSEKPGDDIAETEWFPISGLPEDIAFKNGREMLDKLKEKHKK